MKKRIASFALLTLSIFAPVAHADDGVLARALTCRLSRDEVAALPASLRAKQPGFAKPAAQLALPAMNVYALGAPVDAFGYTSSTVVILPGRVLVAVDGQTLPAVVAKQNLTPEPYSPASRESGPDMFVVAYQVSAKPLAGKVLIGCEYRMREASWPLDGSLTDLPAPD
ncbi:hypothetical protein ACVBGC_20090 [Burkholderia stagnalis]